MHTHAHKHVGEDVDLCGFDSVFNIKLSFIDVKMHQQAEFLGS